MQLKAEKKSLQKTAFKTPYNCSFTLAKCKPKKVIFFRQRNKTINQKI